MFILLCIGVKDEKIIGVYRNQNMHWVGDGFPVKNLFSYDRLGQAISPFYCSIMQRRITLRQPLSSMV